MPLITAYTDHATRPYVRVEIDWADLPGVTHAGVYRVDVATGECTPLRPYVCYDGWELLLSCGHGIFWDTEAPFDTPFYYITTSTEAPCVPNTEPLFLDTFTRTLVDSWGSTETGSLGILPYTLAGGTNPGNYDVNGGKGRMALDTDTVDRTAVIDVGRTDFDLYAGFSTNQTALTNSATSRIVARFTDANNNYQGGINWQPDGTTLIFLTRILAGVQTILAITFSFSAYTPDVEFTLRYQGIGNDFKLKVWPTAGIEPEPWNLEATDTPQALTATNVGILTRRDTGNTNVGMILATDNFTMPDDCTPCTPVTADTSATPTTIPNDAGFWLKDPVRPCNDRPVPLCASSAPVLPVCAGGDGDITFVEIGAEIYADNSLRLRPMNRRRTISITRPRSDVTTSLVLETTTFIARDEVLELAAPGSPLLFQGPSEYGVPDRYMAVGPVRVERQVSDHRIQFRQVSLPYDAVDRPAGPTQGICGTRIVDICDQFATWDEMAAAGFTWDDLIRGRGAPLNPNQRTWDDVLVEFADWDAVDDGTRTWTGLQVGD